MKYISGATYEFETDEKFQAIFISENSDFVFVKLSSGYNEGVSKKKIKKSKLIKKPSVKTISSKPVKNAEILILHTGGTIASKVDYKTGAVSDSFTPKEIISLFPELTDYKIDSELIRNMPSDDMNFSHYNLIAKKIVSLKDKYKGIILTHGTDTLHYTSSALGFILKGIQIPVVVVGSQRSSDRPSSDAATNLINAAYFIKNSKSKGVFVCMHKTIDDEDCLILNAHNIRKLHTTRRDAFKPVNSKEAGVVNYKTGLLKFEQPKTYDFNPSYFKSLKVGMITSRPNMPTAEIELYKDYDGLILQGTGLGHMPIGQKDEYTKSNKQIFDSIKKFALKKPVVMTSQCIHGRINLNVYSPARLLKEIGVIGHNISMTPETAYIKLSWLLSNYEYEEIKKLYYEDISGELNDRTEY
ncbi:MAG: Glu-tRNA(Gln) amidotransferase subunit GatD [Candidatus Woesearchaeota archaeon]